MIPFPAKEPLFLVRYPLVDEMSVTNGMTNLQATDRKNILIVEDHPLFRAMLVQLINAEIGMTVCCEVDNIDDAMLHIENELPDAAIIDLTLQGMNGFELIKKLKARDYTFPMLVISMHDERLYAERALLAGAKGYVSKQETSAEVIKAIRKVLDGQIYVSERVSGMLLERMTDSGKHVQLSGMDSLSDRELHVFQLIGEGMNSRQISEHLKLGVSTVDSYRARIKEKLGIKNAVELYQRAAQWLLQLR